MALSPYRYGFESATQTIPTEQQTAIQVEDSAGQVIDPARNEFVAALVDALGSQAGDTLRVEAPSPLGITSDSPLDVTAATVPVEQQTGVDVDDRTGRDLGKARLMDSGGVLTDPATEATLAAIDAKLGGTLTVEDGTDAEAFANGAALADAATATLSLSASGAERLVGRVTSDVAYSVEVDWKDDAGNVLFTDSVAAAVPGGTDTNLDLAAVSPHVDVRVVEGAGAGGTYTASVYLR